MSTTVYQRLLSFTRSRLKNIRYIKPRDKTLLFKIAVYYTITHSDYFLDRMLALLGRSKAVEKVFNLYVRKLDDIKWFVYRQVCLQAYWLTFRSLGISDKSRVIEERRKLLSKIGYNFRHSLIRQDTFRKCARFFTPTLRFRNAPYTDESSSRPLTTLEVKLKNLGIDSWWSEPPEDDGSSEDSDW